MRETIDCRNCGSPAHRFPYGFDETHWCNMSPCHGHHIPIQCNNDEYLCERESCGAHHILCMDCSTDDEPVVCQFLGHAGIVGNYNLRVLRPNKRSYDAFMYGVVDYRENLVSNNGDWLSIHEDMCGGVDDMEKARNKLTIDGWVESSYDGSIAFCVEDLNIYFCSPWIGDLVPVFYSLKDPNYYDNWVWTSEVFELWGPDGGSQIMWKCPRCKNQITGSDKG